jgi:phosphatidylserine decarboxylase
MTPYPHPIIAREGWVPVALSLAAALVATWLAGWWSVPLWLVAAFVLQFFRDPARSVPDGPGLVVSAADGRVVAVERTRDPYLERDALKISVFMNVFNCHSNRSPVDGEVRERRYTAGRFFNAALDKASLDNERNALLLRTGEGADVTCVQIAGLIARRVLCYAQPGQRLARGERFGFIRFGSRVDHYLPPAARPRVSLGDAARAGTTVLAELPGAGAGR